MFAEFLRVLFLHVSMLLSGHDHVKLSLGLKDGHESCAHFRVVVCVRVALVPSKSKMVL